MAAAAASNEGPAPTVAFRRGAILSFINASSRLPRYVFGQPDSILNDSATKPRYLVKKIPPGGMQTR